MEMKRPGGEPGLGRVETGMFPNSYDTWEESISLRNDSLPAETNVSTSLGNQLDES